MIWPCAAYRDGYLERYTAEEMQQLSAAVPEPLSEIGREVVSIHEDWYSGNTLLTTDDVFFWQWTLRCLLSVRSGEIFRITVLKVDPIDGPSVSPI